MTKEKVNLTNYNEDSIQVLEGLEAVRKRPGMYIGSTDSRGLHHLVYEIVDNAIDEALSGFGDEIIVTIGKGDNNTNDTITVQDFGRGVPTGYNEKQGMSTPEVIFTILHAGGKFGQGGYKSSGGLHGVGSSVVNALSTSMKIDIRRDNKIHTIEFENGGNLKTALEVTGTYEGDETGTTVFFQPDKTIFSALKYNYDTLADRLREKAFLMKGMKIKLVDTRKAEPREELFHYENGLADYIEYLNENKKEITPIQFFEGKDSTTDIEFDIAVQWTTEYSESVISFVNNVRTGDGGTHETGFKTAITRAVNDYAKEIKLLKAKDKNLEGGDIREGLTGIVSVRIPENILQFEGQTKSKLGTSEARSSVDNFIYDNIYHYLVQNKTLSTDIISKAIKAQQLREEAKKLRDKARNTNKRAKKPIISDKLAPPQYQNNKINELYLVEGDSAGGSGKQGRDRIYQAILSLRGKPVNTRGLKLEKILNNEEIATIVSAIGTGAGNDFCLEDRNYDKVVFMTDADVDGEHIKVLLLTFFFEHMKPLIENGHVYIAKPPLFKITKLKEKNPDNMYEYFWEAVEYRSYIKEHKLKEGDYTIQRFKGLGEMNAEQLWETTLNPENRTLIQVTLDNFKRADDMLEILMGDKASDRRTWIEENVDFELE